MTDRVRRALSSVPGPHERVAAAVEQFVAAAADEDLIDVAVTTVDSPLGPLLIASTRRGLVRVAYEDEGFEVVMQHLSERVSPRVLEAPKRLDEERRELDEYFDGKRSDFALPIDWAAELKGFRRNVLQATARVPFGATSTYREIATTIGDPRAARATGNALGSNPMPIVVPCHRILRTGGGLGGYTGGLHRKRFLLALEGVLAE